MGKQREKRGERERENERERETNQSYMAYMCTEKHGVKVGLVDRGMAPLGGFVDEGLWDVDEGFRMVLWRASGEGHGCFSRS